MQFNIISRYAMSRKFCTFTFNLSNTKSINSKKTYTCFFFYFYFNYYI